MSYCRWSSDDGWCDIYCCASVDGGYWIGVAQRRVIGDVPKSHRLGEMEGMDKEELDAFIKDVYMPAHKEKMKWYETAKYEDIGLEHDGKHFSCDTAKEAADILVMLDKAGYHVPIYAVTALYEEAKNEGE